MNRIGHVALLLLTVSRRSYAARPGVRPRALCAEPLGSGSVGFFGFTSTLPEDVTIGIGADNTAGASEIGSAPAQPDAGQPSFFPALTTEKFVMAIYADTGTEASWSITYGRRTRTAVASLDSTRRCSGVLDHALGAARIFVTKRQLASFDNTAFSDGVFLSLASAQGNASALRGTFVDQVYDIDNFEQVFPGLTQQPGGIAALLQHYGTISPLAAALLVTDGAEPPNPAASTEAPVTYVQRNESYCFFAEPDSCTRADMVIQYVFNDRLRMRAALAFDPTLPVTAAFIYGSFPPKSSSEVCAVLQPACPVGTPLEQFESTAACESFMDTLESGATFGASRECHYRYAYGAANGYAQYNHCDFAGSSSPACVGATGPLRRDRSFLGENAKLLGPYAGV